MEAFSELKPQTQTFMAQDGEKYAYTNFMKSTGFDLSNRVPDATQSQAPLVKQPQDQSIPNQYDRSKPQAFDRGPNIAAANPLTRGMDTPNKGLVPGMMPLNLQIGNNTRQSNPYPASDLYGKTPYVKDPNEDQKITDWRATGVGPVTNRTAPGKDATPPLNQGKLGIRQVGIEPKQKTAGMGKGHYVDSNEKNSNRLAMARTELSKERMNLGAVDDKLGAHYRTLGVVAIVSGFISGFMYTQGTSSGAYGAFALFLVVLGSGLVMRHNTISKQRESLHGSKASSDSNMGHPGFRPAYSFSKTDNSERQVYKPLRRGQDDPDPYPKKLDTQTSLSSRLAAQGSNPNRLEGPRSDFGYQYGPEPEQAQGIVKEDFMRDPKLYNMDDRGLEEYMRRLQGEYPDQQYQRYPYHPFAASWEFRQQLDDASRMHGIGTEPGTYNRKFKYRDPRMQMPGAKTMHLKAPPPSGYDTLHKEHPWMEEPVDAMGDPNVPVGDFFQRGQPGGGEQMRGEDDRMRYNVFEKKIDANLVGNITAERDAETKYLGALYGNPKKVKNQRENQAVPGSKLSLPQQEQRDMRQAHSTIQNVQDRTLQYYPQAIGYGVQAVPPHPAAPKPATPVTYGQDPRDQPYFQGPSFQQQMPSPALKFNAPPVPPPKNIKRTIKEESDEVFNNLFSDKAQPSQNEINEAINQRGR